MTILRPITHRIPATVSIQEESSLPFACVITPFAPRRDLLSVQQQQQQRGGINDNNEQERPDNNDLENDDDDSTVMTSIPPLSTVAKCTHCGAPYNPCSPSISYVDILCGLCGKIYSLQYEHQLDARYKALRERMDEVGYKARYYGQGQYDGGRRMMRAGRGRVERQRRVLPEEQRHAMEFALPVATRGFYREHDKNAADTKGEEEVLYSVPSSKCPPLLTLVIDVTSTSPQYYETICSTLQQMISSTSHSSSSSSSSSSSCTRIAIFLLSSRGTVSVFDLRSPLPHLKHCRVPDAFYHSQQQRRRQEQDYYHNTQEEEMVVPLADALPIQSAFVPMNDVNTPHIESAVRALGDIMVITQTCFTHANSSSSSFAADASKDGSNVHLGSSLHAILDLLDDVHAAHPGGTDGRHHHHAATASASSGGYQEVEREVDDDEQTEGDDSSTSFRYAGGKIMCFLSKRTIEFDSNGSRKKKKRRNEKKTFIGSGGFGGACSRVGKRYGKVENEEEEGRERERERFASPGYKYHDEGTTTAAGATTAGGATATTTTTTTRATKIKTRIISNDLQESNSSYHENMIDPESGLPLTSSQFDGDANENDGDEPSRYSSQPKQRQDKDSDSRIEDYGDDDHDDDESDYIPDNLPGSNTIPRVDEYFNELGVRCAKAALGVELFFLLDVNEEEEEKEENNGYDSVGLPILKLMSDRSGGCGGPLIACLNDEESLDCLVREVVARCPWSRPMAYGAMLRIRLTPSLGIDRTPLESASFSSKVPNLAKYYKSAGMMGNVTPSSESQDLWLMGTCDDTTTLTFDLDIVSSSGIVADTVFVDGRGDLELSPCVQSCFAYTTVVESGVGNWVTVRRLRVVTTNLKMAKETESLFSSLDAEALAVVLFHKLMSTALLDGLNEAQLIGQKWLLSTLLCAYRSAELQEVREKIRSDRGLAPVGGGQFYAGERLLNRGGELSDRDVLLAQGHERLSSLPLLLFSLLQSDALRPSIGTFRPTIDAQFAASSHMGCMNPGSLARCIAPRLELWLSGEDETEPIVDNVGMSMEALRLVVAEQHSAETMNSSPGFILLLDSPRQIVVYNCSYLCGPRAFTGEAIIGEALRQSIDQAVRSYRVPPPIYYFLGNNSSDVTAFLHLQDALVEDSETISGQRNFEQWSSALAELVHEEVVGDE